MPFFGCWSCYHNSTMSQFGGDPKERRARGFYGTYKVRRCGKHARRDVTAFGRCLDYHFGLMGAGFEDYDKAKYDEKR